jgi:hypothetical protein
MHRTVAVLAMAVVAGLAAGCGSSNNVAGGKQRARPPVKTVLSTKGTGSAETTAFKVARVWSIHYSFDCSNLGRPGNFSVSVYDKKGSESLANGGATEVGEKQDDGVTSDHKAGTYHLGIDSGCHWTIRVISGQ